MARLLVRLNFDCLCLPIQAVWWSFLAGYASNLASNHSCFVAAIPCCFIEKKRTDIGFRIDFSFDYFLCHLCAFYFNRTRWHRTMATPGWQIGSSS